MYFDETSEQWTYTYYTIDEKDELVTIKTPHFSTFAITYGDTHRANRQVTSEDQTQIINQLRLDAESGKPNEAGAMALAWTELNNYMGGLGTQGSGFYAETMESMKFLTSANFTSLNNALTNYGYGVAIINTVKDMMTAETDAENAKAAYDAFRNMVSSWTSMFARSLTKIASIGTFFIDYSLTAFIDAAFSGSEAAYWNVYQDYYEDRGLGMKPMTYWRDELMKITNSTEPENVSALIEAMTLKYLSQIWDDEAGLAILMKDHGKISFGGLNEDVKTKIMNKYKALFYEETIIPAMKMLEGAYEEQMALEREMALNDLENQVRKAHMVEINFDLPSSWESHLMLATDKVNCGLVSESGGDLFFDGKSYREVAKKILITTYLRLIIMPTMNLTDYMLLC